MTKQNVSWTMGLIADLHYGQAPDALSRLDTFMSAVDLRAPDCILQLGDFNFGVDSGPCMNLWQQFHGPRHHVLGNHDMDKSTKDDIVEIWEMPARYYSFDHGGWHCVVLDRNNLRLGPNEYCGYGNANFYVPKEFRGFADPEQLDWLADDLLEIDKPTVVFAHQGLGMGNSCEPNSAEGAIETVLQRANAQHGNIKACFCGHHHLDAYRVKAGIHYVWVNSASYHWVGKEFGSMAIYTEPLFTFVHFHRDGGIQIEASHSHWRAPCPRERGFPTWEMLNTHISARRLEPSLPAEART